MHLTESDHGKIIGYSGAGQWHLPPGATAENGPVDGFIQIGNKIEFFNSKIIVQLLDGRFFEIPMEATVLIERWQWSGNWIELTEDDHVHFFRISDPDLIPHCSLQTCFPQTS